jgi:L-threonylcarbamoyladenylate synthase
VSNLPKTLRLDPKNPQELARAAKMLRSNGTVAFPTETVYGLGANALSPEAVEKIFVAKQRPHWDPLIVHIADRTQLLQIATDIPQMAEALMEAFWPGPLTLLLPRTEAIPVIVTAGRPLVGVRIPAHPVAQALLREVGIPIAAPSANTFGHTSPTTAAHVLADLNGRIDGILDGGATEVGLESTVAEVRSEKIIIYRPGAITLEMIESVTGANTASFFVPDSKADAPAQSLPSPGVGIRHYAPRAKLILVQMDPRDREHSLLEEMARQASSGASLGVMLPDRWALLPGNRFFAWGDWDDPTQLAHRLFDGLRALDDSGVDLIIAPVPESKGIADAIRDRLQKAARPT